GFGQWGRAMQDDLADGVAWAVSKGHVDGRRVCISGTGYGGYAALLALAKDPGTFRCAVTVSGITDPIALFDSPWSPLSRSDLAQFTKRELIGDPDRDRTALAEVSPVQQAARIKAPVLIAARLSDLMVPIEQSQR